MVIKNINLKLFVELQVNWKMKPEIAFAGNQCGKVIADQCADEPEIMPGSLPHREDTDD